MNIAIDTLIQMGGSLLAIGISYGIVKQRSDSTEQRMRDFQDNVYKTFERDVWKQVSMIRERAHTHDADSAKYRLDLETKMSNSRLEIEQKFGRVEATLTMLLEQMKSSKEMIESIYNRLNSPQK